MKDPLAAWAVAALKHAATAKTLRSKLDKRPSPLAARFSLDPLERRILELAHAAERDFAVAKLARALAGGLTVELLRDALGDGVDAALSPRRPLRRHALVTAGSGGLPAASDPVRAAPGVSARLDGAAEPDALWLGSCRITPNGRGEVPARIAALLHDLDGNAPVLLTLDGCPRREAHELAAGLARTRGRAVLLLDGELLAAAPDAALLLMCARREADCEGDVLVICEAAALGERWRALLAPPAGSVPLVVLADGGRTRDPVAAAPFAVRRLSLHPPAPTATSAAPVADAARAPEPPPDDGLEQVRQLAIRDAERALGIYRAPTPPPRPASTPAPQAAPPPAPTAQPTNAPPRKMPRKAMEHFGRQGDDAESAAPSRPTPPPEPTPPPQAPPPPSNASVFTDGVALELSPSASNDELARAAATSPSASQRIELIGRIRQHKSAAVVASLRANASNPHPGVRAAAEAAMAALFGPNWNATRPVPKPVQPPRSDDKDRGPPGGF